MLGIEDIKWVWVQYWINWMSWIKVYYARSLPPALHYLIQGGQNKFSIEPTRMYFFPIFIKYTKSRL
jgi:hypothetical protein